MSNTAELKRSGPGEGVKEGEWNPPAKIEELYGKVVTGFASMNKPTAGPQSDDAVPVGNAGFQLYSLATPNGQKIGILLEELGIEYDAWVYNIGKGMQFHKGFVEVNPNSKIPCGVDHKPLDGGKPVRLFESAAMLAYLADKHQKFVPAPSQARARAECVNWMMWQMAGQGPITGNFGHFMVYAPDDKGKARDYGATRYGMEVQRLCSVLENHLSDGRTYICGNDYTIADMAILPWFQQIRNEQGYKHPNGVNARDFLTTSQYVNACKWADRLLERPQVQRGMIVCRGKGKPWLEDEKFKHLAKL